jgi:hypothetical protein
MAESWRFANVFSSRAAYMRRTRSPLLSWTRWPLSYFSKAWPNVNLRRGAKETSPSRIERMRSERTCEAKTAVIPSDRQPIFSQIFRPPDLKVM